MLPLVAVATTLIPDLIKILAGDRAGSVAERVAQAVSTTTGTDDAPAAKAKLEAHPALAAELQIKLAQIALDATRLQLEEEDRKRKDALQQLQAQLEAEEQKRKDQLSELQHKLRADLENTAGARSLQVDLAKTGSSLQWVPAIMSGIVIVFFAVAVLMLVYKDGQTAGPYKELLNICVGALVAGFSTVISYWLGSSQGSRDKEITNRQIQEQANRQIEATTRQTSQITTEIIKAAREREVTEPPAARAEAKTDNFERCLKHVLAAEGGFVNDPDDRGGATNLGITIGTLTSWRRRRDPKAVVTADDVLALTREEAMEIYRTNYWNAMRCADLPSGVDLVVFDFGVNAGPATAATILQQILHVAQDGSIGPQTLGALANRAPKEVIREFSQRRLEYYRGLDNFAKFGKGWTSRTNHAEEEALRMAA